METIERADDNDRRNPITKDHRPKNFYLVNSDSIESEFT